MNPILGRVSESGRVQLPADFRRAMGLENGGDVVVELDDGGIRIRTVAAVVAQAQALTRQLLGDAPSATVDAFIAERRRAAKRER